jgi:hypothetical protein
MDGKKKSIFMGEDEAAMPVSRFLPAHNTPTNLPLGFVGNILGESAARAAHNGNGYQSLFRF